MHITKTLKKFKLTSDRWRTQLLVIIYVEQHCFSHVCVTAFLSHSRISLLCCEFQSILEFHAVSRVLSRSTHYSAADGLSLTTVKIIQSLKDKPRFSVTFLRKKLPTMCHRDLWLFICRSLPRFLSIVESLVHPLPSLTTLLEPRVIAKKKKRMTLINLIDLIEIDRHFRLKILKTDKTLVQEEKSGLYLFRMIQNRVGASSRRKCYHNHENRLTRTDSRKKSEQMLSMCMHIEYWWKARTRLPHVTHLLVVSETNARRISGVRRCLSVRWPGGWR